MNQQTKKLPAITISPCESSRIAGHGHCAETNRLALQFKGKDGKPGPVYHYAGFTADDYKALCAAESIGKHFGSNINVRNDDGALKYPFTKIDELADEAPAS